MDGVELREAIIKDRVNVVHTGDDGGRGWFSGAAGLGWVREGRRSGEGILEGVAAGQCHQAVGTSAVLRSFSLREFVVGKSGGERKEGGT